MKNNQTFLNHLLALRKVLIISCLAVVVGFLIIFIGFSEQLLIMLSRPLLDMDVDIINTGLAEVFFTQIQVSFIAGFILASPIVFWQIWAFLKPALYPNERTKFRLTFITILILFVTGALFGYLLVFNITINFFLITGYGIATPMISIDRYISMLFNFVLPFGLVFQLPVIINILSRLGIVNTQKLVKIRKYVIFANFVLAAVLTPPDLLSQIMLGVPMCILYEIGIIMSRFTKQQAKEE